MQPRRLPRLTATIAGLVLAAWLAPALAQYDAPQSPDADPGVRRLAVPFEHQAHNQKAKLKNCVVCHHGLKNGRRVTTGKSTEQRCSNCHMDRPMTHTDPPSLMSVAHASCQGCHKQQGKGPVGCSQCHKQQ